MSARTSHCRRTPFACILLLLIVLRPETNADQLQAASSSAPTGPPQVSPDESVLSEYNPEAPPNPNPPPYTLLRFNEDYTYLADPRNRTDPFDPVKYIPLDHDDPKTYLSFGASCASGSSTSPTRVSVCRPTLTTTITSASASRSTAISTLPSISAYSSRGSRGSSSGRGRSRRR